MAGLRAGWPPALCRTAPKIGVISEICGSNRQIVVFRLSSSRYGGAQGRLQREALVPDERPSGGHPLQLRRVGKGCALRDADQGKSVRRRNTKGEAVPEHVQEPCLLHVGRQ